MFCRLVVLVRLSVPVQVIDWKDSSPKWPIMCWWGRSTLLTHSLNQKQCNMWQGQVGFGTNFQDWIDFVRVNKFIWFWAPHPQAKGTPEGSFGPPIFTDTVLINSCKMITHLWAIFWDQQPHQPKGFCRDCLAPVKGIRCNAFPF